MYCPRTLRSARIQTARSRVQRANHQATASSTYAVEHIKFRKKLKVLHFFLGGILLDVYLNIFGSAPHLKAITDNFGELLRSPTHPYCVCNLSNCPKAQVQNLVSGHEALCKYFVGVTRCHSAPGHPRQVQHLEHTLVLPCLSVAGMQLLRVCTCQGNWTASLLLSQKGATETK